MWKLLGDSELECGLPVEAEEEEPSSQPLACYSSEGQNFCVAANG